jgi:hypothetical protein
MTKNVTYNSKEMLDMMKNQPDPNRYFSNIARLGQKPKWAIKKYEE